MENRETKLSKKAFQLLRKMESKDNPSGIKITSRIKDIVIELSKLNLCVIKDGKAYKV